MLQTWIKILPFFVVEWYSRKYCHAWNLNIASDGRAEGKRKAVSPFLDTYFVIRKTDD